MKVIIRADSSSFIGTGHIMRDLVLANQFDAEIIFATQDLKGNINHKVREAGYDIELLKNNSIEELDTLIKKVSADLIVIDNYDIDFYFEQELKIRNPDLKIFVLDDTYEKHCCDILLNHNINAEISRYDNLVPNNCELRCGSNYTLLRKEFEIEKGKPKPKNNCLTVFVAMGGADHSNKNIEVLKVLENIGDIKVCVLTTTANQYLKQLREYAKDKKWIELEINSTKVAQLMRESDFAIVTPSVTVNEAYFMELPFIAIKTADNQKDIYEYLRINGYPVLNCFNAQELKEQVIKLSKEIWIRYH